MNEPRPLNSIPYRFMKSTAASEIGSPSTSERSGKLKTELQEPMFWNISSTVSAMKGVNPAGDIDTLAYPEGMLGYTYRITFHT